MATDQTQVRITGEQPLPTRPFTRAERDAMGFARRGPDETQLDAWWRLLNGASLYDTPESEAIREAIEKENRSRKPKDRIPIGFGIAKDSEAWNDARKAGITLHALGKPEAPLQADLFAEPLADVQRYAVGEEELVEPKAFAGPPPQGYEIADGCEYDGVGLALAWDEERILVSCPRGACLIPRARWAEGYRSCPGC